MLRIFVRVQFASATCIDRFRGALCYYPYLSARKFLILARAIPRERPHRGSLSNQTLVEAKSVAGA